MDVVALQVVAVGDVCWDIAGFTEVPFGRECTSRAGEWVFSAGVCGDNCALVADGVCEEGFYLFADVGGCGDVCSLIVVVNGCGYGCDLLVVAGGCGDDCALVVVVGG